MTRDLYFFHIIIDNHTFVLFMSHSKSLTLCIGAFSLPMYPKKYS